MNRRLDVSTAYHVLTTKGQQWRVLWRAGRGNMGILHNSPIVYEGAIWGKEEEYMFDVPTMKSLDGGSKENKSGLYG